VGFVQITSDFINAIDPKRTSITWCRPLFSWVHLDWYARLKDYGNGRNGRHAQHFDLGSCPTARVPYCLLAKRQ
jgi:hypothetical protein